MLPIYPPHFQPLTGFSEQVRMRGLRDFGGLGPRDVSQTFLFPHWFRRYSTLLGKQGGVESSPHGVSSILLLPNVKNNEGGKTKADKRLILRSVIMQKTDVKDVW